MRRMNKGKQPGSSGETPAEFVEKGPSAKGNLVQTTVTSTQRLESASLGYYTHIQINVSAFDLRQEPSAVVPHAWDLYGGCRVTGIPTVTSFDPFCAKIK